MSASSRDSTLRWISTAPTSITTRMLSSTPHTRVFRSGGAVCRRSPGDAVLNDMGGACAIGGSVDYTTRRRLNGSPLRCHREEQKHCEDDEVHDALQHGGAAGAERDDADEQRQRQQDLILRAEAELERRVEHDRHDGDRRNG